jgi:peptidoglycan/LPS O-acetylase OafA/YrhL
MTWVVGGHVFAFRAASAFINFEEIQRLIARWWVFLAYGAFFAVDTFFWLSGLLMSYLTLVELNKRKGKMPLMGWVFIYIHRYFRILPLYVFCLLTYMYLVPPLGSGPLWSQIRNMTLDCEQYWWTNLLFINNFVPDGVGNVCFGIGWYLANDMQCFWLAPLLIWMYYKLAKKYTWLVSAALLLFCVVVTIVICAENHFNVMFIASENETGNFHKKIYIKPYCRLGPYVLGLYTGYVYFHYMTRYGGLEGHMKKDPLATALVNWIKETFLGKYICFGLGLLLIGFFIFVQSSAYEDWENHYHTWTETQNVLFLGIEHIGFALGVALVMLPLLFGELQSIWTLLAHPVWTPMARLTFSCFMGHYCLMTFVYSAENYGVVFNQLGFYTDWIYAAVMSWLLAFPLSLLVEVPFGYLEKIICDLIRGGGKRDSSQLTS